VAVTDCEVDGVAVDVPLLVVPCQYMVPFAPPVAVSVWLLQYVPVPFTVTAPAIGLIVTAALPSAPQHPCADRALK